MTRRMILISAALVLLFAFGIAACVDSKSDDDDDKQDRADRETVLCAKLEACRIEDDLGVTDCPTFAADLSDWLLQCVAAAKTCADIADCFNLPENTWTDDTVS